MNIEEISQAVADWAAGDPLVTKVYLFGSRLKGNATANSDLDIAIELRPEPGDENVLATWIGESERLRMSIKSLVPYTVDLQHYDGDETPNIRAYLTEASLVIYEATVNTSFIADVPLAHG
ncbi:MAG: polymerase beta domain protein region [Paucimonas sp.]|nr:polymerase beta domain protein region [Paucimonas sp.]